MVLIRALILCNMLLLVFDSAVLAFSGQVGAVKHTALYALMTVFFILSALFCLLWTLFCTLRQGRRLKMHGYAILSLPIAALIVFLVLNAFNASVFGFSEDNIYFAGPYYFMVGICTYLYGLYAIFVVWRSRKNFEQSEFFSHLLLPLLPMGVGMLNYILQNELLSVWALCAVGLLIIQLYALGEKISLDHLTGLYNRKYLDDYVDDLLQTGRPHNARFAALMLDIDGFKKINDKYGHLEGDGALKTAAELLKKSVRKGDFIARYGGDEFLIIIEECGTHTPARVIRRLRENMAHYNKEKQAPYRIEFSIGYKIFSAARGLKAKDIFAQIDELMYQNKHSKTDSNDSLAL